MLRTIIPTALVVILVLIGGSNHAMAFTVRFGPVPVAEDSVSTHQTTVGADLPTPRMFGFAVEADGATFGPMTPPFETIPTVPAVRIRSQVKAQAAKEPSTPLADTKKTRPRQLSGAEIMLLRGAKQVAER